MNASLRRSDRGGFAMLIVLLTLMALLVLCTPFLMTVRNADQASAQGADRASVELALDAAGRLAAGRLGASHSAIDATPDFDSLDELGIDNRFAEDGFVNANDSKGVMFDLEAHDVSGRIDLNSAPPQVIANATGQAALTTIDVAANALELKLTATTGFQDAGFVWVAGELIGYTTKDGNTLGGLVRGLGVQLDEEGTPTPCGPRPPTSKGANTVVLDQRAWALAQWRAWTAGGDLKRLDAIERLVDVEELVMAEGMGAEMFDTLARVGTVYADVGGGRAWQAPSRVRNQVVAGQDCTLQLLNARWFNPGTTVRITDGETTELGIVRRASGGSITLTDPVANDYSAYAALVQPLARRPVNVNTASREVLNALLVNLQLRGRQSRITPREATELVEVLVESRPFTSFEDFARRLILPAAGWDTLPPDAPVVPKRFQVEEGVAVADAAALLKFIDEDDARALYKNALNANDGELEFSTMPFAFTSTDTHHLDLRAAVNAPSGIERAHALREQVESIVPQRDLLFVATRQEDFEQLFRLDREAPGWATGPWATSRYDDAFQSSPPTRSRAHLGIHDTMPADDPVTEEDDHVFAERDPEAAELGWSMPWAAREDEVGRKQGRMIHCDSESKSLEGRYLPDRTVTLDATDGTVQWAGDGGLMRAFAFSMWLKPRELEEGALFLDCGGLYSDSDRVSLALEDGYLVLRVLDGAGDHPDTSFEEIAKARYELAADDGPGMPLDTWIHVAVDVRGNRPDQITLLVDGRRSGDQLGLTRLKGGLGENDSTITVDSTEGFPDRCVLRIGEELIEATKTGPTTFSAVYSSQGENAGFGGRLARSEFAGVTGQEVPTDLALSLPFEDGTTVELYGYALRIDGNASPGETTLTSDLGRFAVGMVLGMADDPPFDGAQEVGIQLLSGNVFPVGSGMELHAEAVLELEPADPTMPVGELMAAFDPNGGYAILCSATPSITVTNVGDPAATTTTGQSANGNPIGSIEVVHYSGWTDNRITIDQRGDAVKLPNLEGSGGTLAQSPNTKKAWVFEWENVTVGGLDPNTLHTWHTKIFPISLRINGVLQQTEANVAANPRFAQITHLGADSGLTEWVRYDYESPQRDLVRDDPSAINAAYSAAQAGSTQPVDGRGSTGGSPGGSGGVGGAGGGGGGESGIEPPPVKSFEPPSAPPSAPVDGSQWHYRLGEDDLNPDYVVSLAVRSALQFRGVLGTFDHEHSAGTVVLPTWWTNDTGGADRGRPGRFDAVTLIDTLPSDPGLLGMVQHAMRPTDYTTHAFQQGADGLTPESAGAPGSLQHDPLVRDRIWVGLMDALAGPVAGGTEFEVEGEYLFDSRLYTRACKYPSGELPRTITSVAVGGAYDGPSGVPSAYVDELLFGNTDFISTDDDPGAQMVLDTPLDETADAFTVLPDTYRLSFGLISFPESKYLSGWPSDGGLVRIGDEILCYQGYDASTGIVAIAEGGRGMLGTDPQPHASREPVSLLQHLPVSILTGGVSAEDAYLQLASLDDFPSEGLVRIEDELIHYAWQDGGALSMPRASTEPGAMDGEGPGLFRGRFGTTPAAHGTGVPVVLFPFRYWDRWTPRADAPELHYLGASASQPAAFWRTMFFDAEEAGQSGPRLGAVMRTDSAVPWDADPDVEPALTIHYDGLREGRGVPVGAQTDRLEWRFFVRWDPGSFDPETGAAHGWKAAPRLNYVGAEYFAPSQMLRRVAR